MDTDPLLEPPSQIPWPVGQHLVDLSATAATAALADDPWVDLKLRAARWYIGVLQELSASSGLDRYAGVEMALDGCLSNISGAVDAALGRLILALERQAGASPSPEHTYKLELAEKFMRQGSGNAPSVGRLRAALGVDSQGVPVGWLAELRRLRNRSTHHATLSRHFEVEVHEPAEVSSPAAIKLSLQGGSGSVEPTAWLESCLRQATELSNDLLLDARRSGHWFPGI